MNVIKGLILTAMASAIALPAVAAPPANPGSQRNDRASNRGTAQAQQRREQNRPQIERGRPTDPGRSAGRGRPENAGRPEGVGRPEGKGRPENAGRPDGETRGSARSALVNKGQNRLARINADKILAKRLAQVERLRDMALDRDDEDLLARADELEDKVRADYTRRTGLSSEPMTDPVPEPPSEPTLEDPTDPTEPMEPTEPTEPVEPTEPTEPTESL